jgi:hypothetical protein
MFTWRLAAASRRAAEATDQTAEAAQVEAEATVRLAGQHREDRELAWRPPIAIEGLSIRPDLRPCDQAVGCRTMR